MIENRKSFFYRLEPFFVPSVLRDVQLAYTLAKFSHRSQIRKEIDGNGTPVRYFDHVRRVAIILIDEVKVIKQEMIIAALLHDGIEDTRDLTSDMIEHCFGSDITNLVKTLSKVPKAGYLERFYMCNDWRPYVIKCCDRLDNLRSLEYGDRQFQIQQVSETRNKYYRLFDRMVHLTPEDFKPQVQLLRGELVDVAERWATKLEIT